MVIKSSVFFIYLHLTWGNYGPSAVNDPNSSLEDVTCSLFFFFFNLSRTGPTTMRKLVSLWEYMRSHTSSSSADIIMHRASEEHYRETSRVPIPGNTDASDAEMPPARSGLRQQVVPTRLGLFNRLKGHVFFLPLPQLKLKVEHCEFRLFLCCPVNPHLC